MTYKKLLRVRWKPYNMTTMFEDEAKTMKTQPQADEPLAQKKLIINPPARVMPTSRGTGVLGGNQINNS
jgi:hypothetical protein